MDCPTVRPLKERAATRTTPPTYLCMYLCIVCITTDSLAASAVSSLSDERVSKTTDPSTTNSPAQNGAAKPGVTLQFGPADDDVDMQDSDAGVTAQAKRKSRSGKSYAEMDSNSEDDKPLVRTLYSLRPSIRRCQPSTLRLTRLAEQASSYFHKETGGRVGFR